ncbi:hypothetical protein AU106_gp176 [Sinorhizobium phage phiM9]|uniref:Uncharacterized protein n=1 Tax=Sinorhizobium phage phiM9 TaxID=1636182 RepID=A0A0F6R529_9CAUD|nr:hypothetical protein AU106_gp176 [Sinorhizobium phage phiM9]AKE44807.1 hypothetical protein Sm_phiM9_180 [Sinorhizobium phage phiM9]
MTQAKLNKMKRQLKDLDTWLSENTDAENYAYERQRKRELMNEIGLLEMDLKEQEQKRKKK